jgi:hypothetical protein
MGESESQKQEMLRFVHQSLHETSLQHRQSIFNIFSLSIAGLMVVLGGVISINKMSYNLKCVIGVEVTIACFILLVFMWQQRSKSEKAMKIMRKIEIQLRLCEGNVYLPNEPVFTEEFCKPKTWLGLTYGDWLQVLIIVSLGLAIIVSLYLLPIS